MSQTIQFSTTLDEEWAKGLDYFHMNWIYRPQNLHDKDGTPFTPDFFLPEQGAFVHILSDSPLMTLYDIEKYSENSEQIFVLSKCHGQFQILGFDAINSYICRCGFCGRYFFSGGIPKNCPYCKKMISSKVDFWLNGIGESGTYFGCIGENSSVRDY
ncbi:MAG: hypothetical protein ACI4ET_07395 [Bilifractor sp.]